MPFCVMNLQQYLSGDYSPEIALYLALNLHSQSNRDEPFEESKWAINWDITRQIANGLHYLHACKIIHRDLKPRNSSHSILSSVYN